ncbi:ladderlectin-like [Enoplosus armatus]|uniref:ladderlectin-like n=1 Tax=Enoplosus armatus TaxID=215367 RepID=UPI0039938D9D
MLTVSLLLCALMALAGADGECQSADPHVLPAAPAPSCSEGWSEHNGRCFQFVPREMSWADAEKNCLTLKGNLASVHSVEEYQFIQAMITAQTQASPSTWVGGSDCQQNNVWFWSDGKVFSFTFWCSGEPEDRFGNQSCLQMNHGGENCWDDTVCSNTLPSVCAVDL